MLRWTHIARFALQHSPEREERLLSFAAPTPNAADSDDTNENVILPVSIEGQKAAADAIASGDVTLSDRQEFHDALFKAIQADDQLRVLEAYRPEIESHLGTVETPQSEKDLDEVMQLTRLSIIDELNREERERNILARDIRNLDTTTCTDEEIQEVLVAHQELIGRYFKLSPNLDPRCAMDLIQCLLFKDMERIRARDHERETGIKWTFLKEDEFAELYRKLSNIPAGKDVRIPNAFAHGNTMYFNNEHPDFTDPERGELNAQRAVTHEATHLAIKAAETKFNIDGWINTLRSHPDWEKLKAAVEQVFASDPSYINSGGRKNERIVNEALAIYAANSRHPAPDDLANEGSYRAQQEVTAVLQGMFDTPHTGFLAMLKKDLEARLDHFLEVKSRTGEAEEKDVGNLLAESSKEAKLQRLIAERAEGKRITNEGDNLVQTNADEGKKAAAQDLNDASESSKNEKTPALLLERRKKVGKSLDDLGETYPSIRQNIMDENVDPGVKDEALAALDQNLEWISQQQTDLIVIEKAVGRIADAETKMAEGNTLTVSEKKALHGECIPDAPNPYDSLTDESTDEEIAKADETFAKNREAMLNIAHDVLAQTERIAERIKKGATIEEEFHPPSVPEEGGIMNWLRKNVWGPNSGIIWITPLNIMHIIKTYKEAIAENYRSNQTVKENRLAKELNFYQPIQHTLNKQARSSNEKETSEFKEYIEREGFTFKEIFGADGRGLSEGVLYQNRHNFNRAKAVLLYAADHAWLYFMDRLHGRDVYGVDYEGVEGHQSFEELVNQHEAGKSKQIDHGRERVDKDPDVPPIMDAMVHELRLKNIFAVQGIMKRLQEKAKFSHSNTWMLTTLLMLIRDESDKDPTLKLCLDKGMIDNISNFTIEQSAWSITWLKVKRNAIEKWKRGDKFANNEMTAALEEIERQLKAAGCNFPNTDKGNLDKYEAIAMVMAGKTFSAENDEARNRGLFKYGVPRAAVSIFDNNKIFNDYRQDFQETVASTDTDPDGTDSDYFNPGNGGSDLMLLDPGQVSRILSRKSTSEWNYVTKARGFVTQVFMRYDELERLNPAALEVFKKEMRAKFDYCMDGVWDKSRRATVVKDTDLQGNNMVDQLASRGLLSESKIKELAASDLRPSILTAKRVMMKPM